jgi:hypothetical protein
MDQDAFLRLIRERALAGGPIQERRPPPPADGSSGGRFLSTEEQESLSRMLADREAAGLGRDVDPLEAALFGAQPLQFNDTLPANAWNYLIGASVGRMPQGFDDTLTMQRMLEQYGISGWGNLAAQAGLGAIEPGPGDFARWGPSLLTALADLPVPLLRSLGRATSLTDPSGLPLWVLHGTPRTFTGPPRPSRAGMMGPGYYGGIASERTPAARAQAARGVESYTGAFRHVDPTDAPQIRTEYRLGRYADYETPLTRADAAPVLTAFEDAMSDLIGPNAVDSLRKQNIWQNLTRDLTYPGAAAGQSGYTYGSLTQALSEAAERAFREMGDLTLWQDGLVRGELMARAFGRAGLTAGTGAKVAPPYVTTWRAEDVVNVNDLLGGLQASESRMPREQLAELYRQLAEWFGQR